MRLDLALCLLDVLLKARRNLRIVLDPGNLRLHDLERLILHGMSIAQVPPTKISRASVENCMGKGEPLAAWETPRSISIDHIDDLGWLVGLRGVRPKVL